MHERATDSATRGRVRCTQVSGFTGRRCQAERILSLSAVCFVCGGHQFERVPATSGDIPFLYADLLEGASSLVDLDPSPEHRALAEAVTRAINARLDVELGPGGVAR